MLIQQLKKCPDCGSPLRTVMARIGGRVVTFRECADCDFTTKPPEPDIQ